MRWAVVGASAAPGRGCGPVRGGRSAFGRLPPASCRIAGPTFRTVAAGPELGLHPLEAAAGDRGARGRAACYGRRTGGRPRERAGGGLLGRCLNVRRPPGPGTRGADRRERRAPDSRASPRGRAAAGGGGGRGGPGSSRRRSRPGRPRQPSPQKLSHRVRAGGPGCPRARAEGSTLLIPTSASSPARVSRNFGLPAGR